MMFMPYRDAEKADATNYMVDVFKLVFPEKIAKEVVAKDVKLIYDPTSGELTQIVIPFMTKTEVTTLKLDKGWVTEASVEDVKLLPGVHRTMFRLHGGNWVVREVVKAVESGQVFPGSSASNPLLQRISSPSALADLGQIVIARQLSQVHFDRVSVRPGGFLDFLNSDFSARLSQLQHLAGKCRQ
jgi:hypothetical protein